MNKVFDIQSLMKPTNKEHKFYIYSKDEMSTIIQDGVLQNIIKSQLSKTASQQSSYILSLDNFTKSENENKWSKLFKK